MMGLTDLQASLITIGVVIIVAVVAYNKWQEYRARKSVEQGFSHLPEDILMQSVPVDAPPQSGTKREPVLGAEQSGEDGIGQALGQDAPQDAGQAESADTEPVPVNPVLVMSSDSISVTPSGEAVAPSGAESPVAPEPDTVAQEEASDVPADDTLSDDQPISRALPVDEMIDYRIALYPNQPVWGEKLLSLLQSCRYAGSKPINCIGLTKETRADAGEWLRIMPGKVYHQLIVGVQMADRTAAISEAEYAQFIAHLRSLVEEIRAELEVPDMAVVLSAANRLYQFVIGHDVRLGINICSDGAPWEIRTLVRVLEQESLRMETDGTFVRYDRDGSALFSVQTNVSATAETVERLTIFLDVTCVAEERNGFSTLRQCAEALCRRLGGVLLDDAETHLSDKTLEVIAEQVGAFYADMSAAGIPAGSLRALRLFN
ncbi:MAG: cell division protein [Burkholderiaceae bacterium]|jgi:FtsZ-interacting cell division protein ZipA|nr:cell division protein [Burkholderiaceae bacterium]